MVDPFMPDYWHKTLKPLVEKHKDLVEYLGELNDKEKGLIHKILFYSQYNYYSILLGNALALLFPIEWAEPFGMVLIESMACGTPVIARRRGAVPEVCEKELMRKTHRKPKIIYIIINMANGSLGNGEQSFSFYGIISTTQKFHKLLPFNFFL